MYFSSGSCSSSRCLQIDSFRNCLGNLPVELITVCDFSMLFSNSYPPIPNTILVQLYKIE